MKALKQDVIAAYPRGLLCIALMAIAVVVCINPPHDNEYDPENPNKAKISGTVYGLMDQTIPDAEILLMQDTDVTDSTTSDADGYYEISDIDPGIYQLVARAPHYIQYNPCEPESLPAETDTTIDIWFCAQFYCFEEEEPGTVEPYGFDTIRGIWAVIEDGTGPGLHSTPNVYHGEKTMGGPALALLKNSSSDFYLEAKFKVLETSGMEWLSGVVFGYHGDPKNFYFLGVTHQGISLNKVVDSIPATLEAVPRMFPIDTWFGLSVQMCGPDIYINVEGEEINYTDNNQPFSGKAGLWVDNPSGPAMVNFDDVLIGR